MCSVKCKFPTAFYAALGRTTKRTVQWRPSPGTSAEWPRSASITNYDCGKPVNVTLPGLSLLARLSPRQELAPSPRLPNNSLSSPPPRARSRPKRTVGDCAMLMPPGLEVAWWYLSPAQRYITYWNHGNLKISFNIPPPPVLHVHSLAKHILGFVPQDLCTKDSGPLAVF